MAKLRLLAATLLTLTLSLPAQAQTTNPDWCLRTTVKLVASGCNIAKPGEERRTITTGAQARTELIRQANALLTAGLVSKARYDAELKRISLTAPASEDSKVWRFLTDDPDTYVWIIVSAR